MGAELRKCLGDHDRGQRRCRSTCVPTGAQDGNNGPMVEMSSEDFEQAVDDALELVPAELLDLVDNVVILIEDDSPEGEPELLGLYDGVSLTDRGSDWGFGELPDRIFIYRNPTLAICDTIDEVRDEVAVTVVHEIAHHFGIDDERLHALGWD